MRTNALMLFISAIIFLSCFSACNQAPDSKSVTTADSVAGNIKMYTAVWDKIINEGKIELLNNSSFTEDVVFRSSPSDIVGLDSARTYYKNYIVGFSEVKFTMIKVFGMGNDLVKQWNFKGKHTGIFFGIPPTGKSVNVDGVTIVRMQNGKIAEERDFIDNLEFMQQLGLIPRQ